jgi:hypothetical protein
VAIKASAAAEVKALVEALVHGDDVVRESAIARLAIIGSRATDRLISTYGATSDRDARIVLLRAMEPLADRRAAPLARRALKEGSGVSVAAAAVLRALLDSPDAPTATSALDNLVSGALDRESDQQTRLACFEALQDVPGGVRDRIAEAWRREQNGGLRKALAAAPREVAAADAVWADALSGPLPDDPVGLREALQTRAGSVALTALQKLIDSVRAKESVERSPVRRAQWRAVRGALHQALSMRNSRVALYDLRETLAEALEPLPVSFLAAVHVLGDRSCLEPLAAAYSRARPDDTWWRHQLGAAFQAIARRERMTKRHAVIKRIQHRWPEAVGQIAPQ